MDFKIPLFPDQASVMAEKVDYLYFYILGVTVLGGLGVYAVLGYFCARYVKYREGVPTPRILGSHKLELFWTITPLLIFLTFFAWGVYVYDGALHPPADAPEIFVVGKRWMWKIQHPSGAREINELHLAVGRPVKVTLVSEDVIHDFGIPAFRQKVDVLPNRYVSTWYTPTKVGKYHLFCDQYCGAYHSLMVGSVYVMEQTDFDDWLKGKTDGSKGAVDGSLAWEGGKLFKKLQCVSCHSGDSKARAPVLGGLYGTRVPLADGGSVIADENYIRESILKPRAKVHQGWQPIMPTFQGQVDEAEMIALIAYIKSLRPGEAPIKADEFPAPVGAPTTPEGRAQQQP
jgi:cytochrome c oxidase subunit II